MAGDESTADSQLFRWGMEVDRDKTSSKHGFFVKVLKVGGWRCLRKSRYMLGSSLAAVRVAPQLWHWRQFWCCSRPIKGDSTSVILVAKTTSSKTQLSSLSRSAVWTWISYSITFCSWPKPGMLSRYRRREWVLPGHYWRSLVRPCLFSRRDT